MKRVGKTVGADVVTMLVVALIAFYFTKSWIWVLGALYSNAVMTIGQVVVTILTLNFESKTAEDQREKVVTRYLLLNNIKMVMVMALLIVGVAYLHFNIWAILVGVSVFYLIYIAAAFTERSGDAVEKLP